MELKFASLILKSSIYFPVLLFVISSFRFVGFYDPLLRVLIWPIGGLVYLFFSPNLFSADGFYFLLVLISLFIFCYFVSTPKLIPPKICTSPKVMFVAKGILLLMFFFSFADLILNAGFENSAYTAGTFDTRGSLSSSPIRFLKGAVGIPSLMILLMFRKYSRPIYVYFWIFVFVVNIIPMFMSPGKALIITPLFLFLDLLFFNNVIEGNYILHPCFVIFAFVAIAYVIYLF